MRAREMVREECRFRTAAAVAALGMLVLAGAQPGWADAAANREKVLTVEQLDLTILESMPPKLVISALGTVPTTGWTDGRLDPRPHPVGGIYEFDLTATPPAGIALEVIMPIAAQLTLDPMPPDLRGVRVYARQNSKEKDLRAAKRQQTKRP